MVKTFSSSAGAVGSVPGQGIKNAALHGWDKKIKKNTHPRLHSEISVNVHDDSEHEVPCKVVYRPPPSERSQSILWSGREGGDLRAVCCQGDVWT